MNDFESACKNILEKKGYIVLRNGWPDFLVLSSDYKRGYALELKRNGDKLSDAQNAMHTALARFGILTHVLRNEQALRTIKSGRVLLHEGDLRSMESRLRDAREKAEQAISDVAHMENELALASSMFADPAVKLQAVCAAAKSVDTIDFHNSMSDRVGRERATKLLNNTLGVMEASELERTAKEPL